MEFLFMAQLKVHILLELITESIEMGTGNLWK